MENVTLIDTIVPTIARLINGSLIVTLGNDPTPIPDPVYSYNENPGVLSAEGVGTLLRFCRFA